MSIDGGSDSHALRSFYDFTFSNLEVQNRLMKCKSKKEFIKLAVELGNENGFSFTENDMSQTISPFTKDVFSEFDTTGWEDHKWEKKIVDVGWAPLGYSKT